MFEGNASWRRAEKRLTYTRAFIIKKILSQWSCPDFISLGSWRSHIIQTSPCQLIISTHIPCMSVLPLLFSWGPAGCVSLLWGEGCNTGCKQRAKLAFSVFCVIDCVWTLEKNNSSPTNMTKKDRFHLSFKFTSVHFSCQNWLVQNHSSRRMSGSWNLHYLSLRNYATRCGVGTAELMAHIIRLMEQKFGIIYTTHKQPRCLEKLKFEILRYSHLLASRLNSLHLISAIGAIIK